MRPGFFLIACLFVLSGCRDWLFGSSDESNPLTGVWRRTEVLANDHWGGELTWWSMSSDREIGFASDGVYFEGTSSSILPAGRYALHEGNRVEITLTDSVKHRSFRYEFNAPDQLILHKNQFEGIVAEKYVRTHMKPRPRSATFP